MVILSSSQSFFPYSLVLKQHMSIYYSLDSFGFVCLCIFVEKLKNINEDPENFSQEFLSKKYFLMNVLSCSNSYYCHIEDIQTFWCVVYIVKALIKKALIYIAQSDLK